MSVQRKGKITKGNRSGKTRTTKPNKETTKASKLSPKFVDILYPYHA